MEVGRDTLIDRTRHHDSSGILSWGPTNGRTVPAHLALHLRVVGRLEPLLPPYVQPRLQGGQLRGSHRVHSQRRFPAGSWCRCSQRGSCRAAAACSVSAMHAADAVMHLQLQAGKLAGQPTTSPPQAAPSPASGRKTLCALLHTHMVHCCRQLLIVQGPPPPPVALPRRHGMQSAVGQALRHRSW
jgi:hypothetical protein